MSRGLGDVYKRQPETLNEDPYGAWIYKVEQITAEAELLDADEYAAFCASEG